jgi:hypothetical protein
MQFAGYKIPMDLVYLTGGGPDDWKQISDYHIEMYRKYMESKPKEMQVREYIDVRVPGKVYVK